MNAPNPKIPVTLEVAFTCGGHGWNPGGVILRLMPDGMYVAHHFNRDAGSSTPIAFYWGVYGDTLQKGRQAYRSKLNSVEALLVSPEKIADERKTYES